MIALSILVVGAVVAWDLRSRMLDQAEREAADLGQVLVEQTNQTFRAAELTMQLAADRLAIAGDLSQLGATPAAHDLLTAIKAGVPQLDSLSVVDATGNIVAFNRFYPVVGINVADRDYFGALQRNEMKNFVSAPVRNRANGRWNFYTVHRLEFEGRFVGAVMAGFDIAFFERVFADINLDRGASLTLFRRDGILLARWPRVEETIGKSYGATRPFVEIVGPKGTGTLRVVSSVDGVSRLMALTTLKSMPLTVNVTFDADKVLQPWRAAIVPMAIGCSAASIAILFLTWRVRCSAMRLAARTEQLRRAQRNAEAANLAKSDFLATMSHELRTPLTAVLGFADLLRADLPAMREKRREFAENIRDAGEHLLALIGDVLDLAKIEAGRRDLDEQEVGLVELLQSLRTLSVERAQQERVRLVVELPDPGLVVACDRLALLQLLLNLVVNGLKYTPPDGSVKVRTRVESGNEFAGQLTFLIEDTGTGIASDEADALFDPYRRAERDWRARKEGVGLGLAIVRELVELHGGTVRLDVRPEGGTVATVRLPATRLRHRPMLLAAAG